MEYIVIGILLSIGWHLAKLAYEVTTDLLFARLHDARWYRELAGKEKPKKNDSKPGDIHAVKRTIGFDLKGKST